MDIFDKIISKEIPSSKIYEDNFVYSFLDIEPKTKGHCLVIPKICVNSIEEFSNPQLEAYFLGLKNTIIELKKIYSFNQYNLIQNNGELAGQEVFHLHFHIIPQYGTS